MFELLLQADKAIAGGLLDQAEKTYWQLIELDPSNAIAVAGLARISMERGDQRMARTFAERALGIDPDSILARRLIDSIERGTAGGPDDNLQALPLLAAERLEAMSRRRSKDAGATGDSPETPDNPEVGPPKGATAEPTATPKKERGKTRPDQIGALPAEPLRERRQAGRLAAAAAAAAAAAREPTRTRHEPHHAMPVGRFRFDAGSLKAPPRDEFAAAEMAAAVAAVDDQDDAITPETALTPPRDEFGDLVGMIDATAADDSVAIRLAMLGSIDMDAAELEAAREAESEGDAEDMFEAAEAESEGDAEDMFEAAEAASSGYLPHSRPAMQQGVTAPAASESEPHWPSLSGPSEFDGAEEAAAAEAAEAAADAAEAAAASEAFREVSGRAHAAPPLDREDRPALARRLESPADQNPTEEEAEAQALREAMAIVLAGDGEVEGNVEPDSEPGLSTAAPQAAAEAAPEQEAATETAPEPEPAAPAPDPAADPAPPESEPAPERRKGGLFHRNRGN